MEPMPSLSALRCVACGAGGLQPAGDLLDCPGCGRAYPVVADVPVMFADAYPARGPLLEPAVVRTVLQAMDLPADTGNMLRVRRASGARASYGGRQAAAGGAQFLRLVHASGHPVPAALLGSPAAAMPDPPAGGEPRCRWVADYVPRALPPGHSFLANVRFENAGDAPMRHAGPGRVAIAFAWLNAAGDPEPGEDFRTPLPLDLPPGQALTLPVRIVAPAAPGRYGLLLRMVQEGVRWLEPDHGPLRVTVRPGAGFVPPPHWDVNANATGDRLADHGQGAARLRGWLQRLPPGPGLRLLEVGGNAKPALSQLPGEAYNVDIDLMALQVGCVAGRARGNLVRGVCADAFRLPFADGFFDAIVMFATLHQMPDPAALLRSLRAHLRPGGFIGVLCEPVGQAWPGATPEAMVEAWRHGVNEQGFSLEEYAQMFRAAGLEAADLALDHDSLKARLVPERCDA